MRFEPDEIKRSRRKTLSLEIKKDGRFVVHAPLYMDMADICAFIEQKQDWIAASLFKSRAAADRAESVDFSEGSLIPFMGRMIRLSYHDRRSVRLVGAGEFSSLSETAASSFAPLDEAVLLLPSPLFSSAGIKLAGSSSVEEERSKNRALVQQWYRLQASSVLNGRTELYAARMGLEYDKVHITGARTNWGSCNAKGGINYSLHLMCVSLFEIDYVVVHELSHIRHRDHSPAFYREVATILPDYKKRNSALKANAWVLEL